MELFRALTLAELGRDGGSLDDLNAWESDTVTGCHFIVHLFDRTIECCVSVFLVHVVIAGSTLIPQPDTIVLDLCWILLKYLGER